MSLSPALLHWRDELARFPEEIAIALGPLLPRLASLIGPLGASWSEGSGPNGYDGVTQRGDYQRLVTSDWLLALHEPDEFLRRAVMHEHSFLKLALHEPRGSRRSILLFDAGPSQLGSPRLVHLALLLVLGRRACAARAELVWTTLQRPALLRHATEDDDVRALLEARSPLDADPRQLTELERTLGPLSPQDDLWVIGGPSGARAAEARGFSSLTVTDPLRAENDRLEVIARTRGRERALSLPLPEPRLRTQLLRNPFEAPRSFTVPEPSSGAFFFSPDGKRLLFREEAGVRTRMALSTAGGWGAPRVPAPGDRMIAATWHKKTFYSLLLRSGRLYLSSDGEEWQLRTTQRTFEPPFGDAPLCPLYVFGRRRCLLVRDATGVVFAGQLEDAASQGPFELRPILAEVLKLVWRRSHLEYVARAPREHVELGRITLELGLFPQGKSRGPVRGDLVLSGFEPSRQIGAFAVERQASTPGSSHWEVIDGGGSTDVISLPETDRPLGLFLSRESSSARPRWLFLVFSSLDGRLHAADSTSRQPLPAFGEGVTELVQSDVADRVAYRGADGRVRVLETPFSTVRPVLVSPEAS